MDSPPCFTSYTPARRAPCARCAWAGPCARATEVAGFTFLSHPRFPKEVTRTSAIPTTHAEEVRDAILAAAKEHGLAIKKATVCVHRKRMADVVAGAAGTVLLKFALVPAMRLCEMPSASRAAIRPCIAGSVRGATIADIKERRRLGEHGSDARVSSVEDAVSLLLDVARNVYGDAK